jgi:Alpha-L-arabinofuranosidase B, catalytic
MVHPFPSSLALQELISSDRRNADLAAVGRAPVTMRPPMPTDNATRGYAVGDLWMFGGNLWRAEQVSAETASWTAVFNGAGPPLDAVSGAAPVAAYGTRRLRAAYTGEALNVVRASDSTAIDIGFRGDGSLDTPRLDAFLASTVGRIVIWYDRSGAGNNATQAWRRTSRR